MAMQKIDLTKFRGNNSSIFTGRPQGLIARGELKLDEIDKNNDVQITFTIPDSTTSFNPSFYLGLLYSSFEKLGVEKFDIKYKFEILAADPETVKVIQRNLDDGKRNAINELNKNTGLWQFIKKKDK